MIGICGSGKVMAQRPDSLLAALRAHPAGDTTRVNIINAIALYYKRLNADSVIPYANEAVVQAQALHFERGIFQGLQSLGNAYLYKNDLDQARAYFTRSLQLCEKNGDMEGKSTAVLCLGNVSYRSGERDKAEAYYKQCVELSRKTRGQKNLAYAYMNLGSLYNDVASYVQAIDYYLLALKIMEANNYADDVATCHSNIAAAYMRTGNYKSALDYNNRSQAHYRKTGNKTGVLSTYVNAGVIYGDMGDNKDAVMWFDAAIRLADSVGDNYWKNIAMLDIAEVYYDLKQLDTAYEMFTRALKYSEETGNIEHAAICHFGIGRMLVGKGKTAEGIPHLLAALQPLKESGLKEYTYKIASVLSETYEQLHDYRSALLYSKMSAAYMDSTYKEQSDKRVMQLQYDYELEKRESKIGLLEKDKEIRQNHADNQRITMWALVAGVVLLLVIVVLLYRGRLAQIKGREILLKRKEEIKKQAAELAALNQFKNKTFSILSHDLRGPIYSISSTLALLDDDDFSADEFMALKPEMTRQLNAITILLDNLLKWAKSSMEGNISARPVNVNLYEVAQQNLSLLFDAAELKLITLKNEIPLYLTAWCDPAHIDIAIRNLLANAIKYTHLNGLIKIGGDLQGNMVHLYVTDNGVGMSQEQVAGLFTSVDGNSTYGTAGEKGIGIGLTLCHDFIKANSGSIMVNSEQGKGTTFTLILHTTTAN